MKRYVGFLCIVISGCQSTWNGYTTDNPDHCASSPTKCVAPSACDPVTGMCYIPNADSLNDCQAKSLVDAIERGRSAHSTTTYRIVLKPGCRYVFDATNSPNNYWYGPNALPPIDVDLSIDGNGSALDRTNAPMTPFRFFYVAGPPNDYLNKGRLTLSNLIVHGGLAQGGSGGSIGSSTGTSDLGGKAGGGGGAGLGGAIFSHGDVQLFATSFVDNQAQGGQGGAGLTDPLTTSGAGGGGLGGSGGSATNPVGATTPSGTGGGGWNGNGCPDGTGGSFTGRRLDCLPTGEGGHPKGLGGTFSAPGTRSVNTQSGMASIGATGGKGGGDRALGGTGGSSNIASPGSSGSSYDGGGGGDASGTAQNTAGGGGGAGFVGNGGASASLSNLGGGGGATGGGGGGSSEGGGGGGGGGVGGGGGGGGAVGNADHFVGAGGGGGFGGGGGAGGYGGNGGFGGGGGAGQWVNGGRTGGLGGFGGGKGSPQMLADGTQAPGGGGGGGLGAGGAIFLHRGTLTAANTTFLGNGAHGGDRGTSAGGQADSISGSGFGGAIFALNATVTLANVTAIDNVTLPGAVSGLATNLEPSGGGNAEGRSVYLLGFGPQDTASSGSLTLKNCILGSQSSGGGINALQSPAATDVVINNSVGPGSTKLDASLPNLMENDIVYRGSSTSQSSGGVHKGTVGFTVHTGVDSQRWYLAPATSDAGQLGGDTTVCAAPPVGGVDEISQPRGSSACTLGAIELPAGTAIGSQATGCSLPGSRSDGRAGLFSLLLGAGAAALLDRRRRRLSAAWRER